MARVNVVKEEKEARLKAFVSRHIEALSAAGASRGVATYRLIALSTESPAARALQDLAPELAKAGIAVEAVVFRRAAPVSSHGLEHAERRFVNDVRFLDAHEQLVLDATTTWIGDCMRRDPLKRDAFELFSDRCPVTARHAARSFAQIWRAAGPSGSLTTERRWAVSSPHALFDLSLLAGAETPVQAPLRH
jgi:hypothetical protein